MVIFIMHSMFSLGDAETQNNIYDWICENQL